MFRNHERATTDRWTEPITLPLVHMCGGTLSRMSMVLKILSTQEHMIYGRNNNFKGYLIQQQDVRIE